MSAARIARGSPRGFGILFPRTDYIVAGVMISLQLGTMVGFVTAVSDLLVPFSAAQRANRCLWTEYRLGDAALRGFAVLVWLVGKMLPLRLPRRVASLRLFSIIGVTLAACFVLVVVAHAPMTRLPHVHELKCHRQRRCERPDAVHLRDLRSWPALPPVL